MRCKLIAILITCLTLTSAVCAQAGEGDQQERICYSATDTRTQIVEHHLIEPFGLLRKQALENHADAISVRLCRIDGTFVYELDLLRRDGRLLHTRFDAASGKPVVNILKP